MNARISSLVAITGGQEHWYSTHAKLAAAEAAAGVEWDGVAGQHKPRGQGCLARSKTGSWAREVGGRAYALTAAECVAAGLTPGPANA